MKVKIDTISLIQGAPGKVCACGLSMRCAGVSLIELMIAMTISLVLLLGIAQIYSGSKETYRINEDLSMMQETTRFGFESLTGAIIMADHWGGVPSADISVTATGITGGTGDCNAAWVTNIGQAVFGAEGAANISSVTGFQSCLSTDRYVPNSDVLIVRYAAGQPIGDSDVQSTSNPDRSNDLYVRTATGEKGTLFWGGVSPVSATGLSTENGTNNYVYRVEAFFLRPCSTLDASSNCTDGIPTLAKLTFDDSGSVVQEAQVDGVEQIQYQYGIDTNADGQVEQFASATNVANWNQVVAVRIDMLVRTVSEDSDYIDTNTTYTLAGGTADNGLVYTVPTADRGFHRKQLAKVVQIRNRTRF
ncbi:MAG: prepilin-type N-terminal cleavage/methylation domain-containing protein [Gammaproteobacteria bacterium]|nr:prepilin-type N-terminal cleavage/methylation domain-containing protein [Gammaproteobacteria bacterium]